MAVEFKISPNAEQLARVDAAMAEFQSAIPKVLTTAVNEATRKFRTRLVDLIKANYGAKRKEIFDRVRITDSAYAGKSGLHITGQVSVFSTRVAIHDFSPTYGKRTGARVQFSPADPVEVFKHAFRATMKSGHTGTFGSKMDSPKVAMQSGSYAGRIIKRGPMKGRLLTRRPIKELFGPPLPVVFDRNPKLADEATRDMEEVFSESLERSIRWQLEKAREG